MPWEERTPMAERKRFIEDVEQGEESVAALCRRYGVSRKTGYKWLKRYREEGESGLQDRSRRRTARRDGRVRRSRHGWWTAGASIRRGGRASCAPR